MRIKIASTHAARLDFGQLDELQLFLSEQHRVDEPQSLSELHTTPLQLALHSLVCLQQDLLPLQSKFDLQLALEDLIDSAKKTINNNPNAMRLFIAIISA